MLLHEAAFLLLHYIPLYKQTQLPLLSMNFWGLVFHLLLVKKSEAINILGHIFLHMG